MISNGMSNEQLILENIMELKATIGELKGSVDEIKDAHHQRLEDLENSQRWIWRAQLLVVPVVEGLHQIAARMGFVKH